MGLSGLCRDQQSTVGPPGLKVRGPRRNVQADPGSGARRWSSGAAALCACLGNSYLEFSFGLCWSLFIYLTLGKSAFFSLASKRHFFGQGASATLFGLFRLLVVPLSLSLSLALEYIWPFDKLIDSGDSGYNELDP